MDRPKRQLPKKTAPAVSVKRVRENKAVSIKPDDVFRSDDLWIRLMSNRNYVRDFMDVILKNKTVESTVCYQGNFFFSGEEDISPLIDAETHDIVSLIADRFTPVDGQKIYSNMTSYFLDHRPISDCINIYLVADVHGESVSGDFGVHWNCLIVNVAPDGFAEQIAWYDPAYSRESIITESYNFNKHKREAVNISLYRVLGTDAVKAILITPRYQAQRICNADFSCVDSFCQSWVLLMVAAVVQNKIQAFLNLPFDEYGNLILKTWLFCLIKNEGLTEWMKELQSKGLKKFEYCRLPPTVFSSDIEVAKNQLRIVKVETLPKKAGQTCLDAVLERFKE